MSAKMQVIFVKDLGHVLAAFTRAADPEGMPKIEDVTGGSLLVRNPKVIDGGIVSGGQTFAVPPDSLELAVVESNPAVLSSPYGFVVAGDTTQTLGSGNVTLTLGEDTLKVDVGGAGVAGNLKVWAQVEKVTTSTHPEPVLRVMKGVIESGKHDVTLTLTTKPGGNAASIPTGANYHVLVLVEGRRAGFETKNLPTPT